MANRLKYLSAFFCFAVFPAIAILLFFKTGVFYYEGDSATHYLIARYAPAHPELFFHHWGKPVFTILASPWAQFGLTGMVLFNALSTGASAWFSALTAKELGLKWPYATAIILLFSPFAIILSLSGMTEPLFALLLSLALYSFVSERYVLTSVIVSFLPFSRSEGLVILLVFAFFFILEKKWKPLVLLVTGHLFFAFSGLLAGKSFGWVISEIPYARLSSQYGSGNWDHFLRQLIFITGVPVFLLLLIGIVTLLILLIKRKDYHHFVRIPVLLVFAVFFAFFAFHSIAWATGWFSSMGLKRVLVAVLPPMAVIAIYGLNSFSFIPLNRKWFMPLVSLLWMIYVVAFPFTHNPAALDINKDLHLRPDQKAICQAAGLPEVISAPFIVYSHPFFPVCAGIDPFDSLQVKSMTRTVFQSLPAGSAVVWDEWFSVQEDGCSMEMLLKESSAKHIKSIMITDSITDLYGHVEVFVINR